MTRDEAIARARALAQERGWTWHEPVNADLGRAWVVLGARRWTVTSNAGSLGTNVHVVLDDATGAVIRAAFWPR